MDFLKLLGVIALLAVIGFLADRGLSRLFSRLKQSAPSKKEDPGDQ